MPVQTKTLIRSPPRQQIAPALAKLKGIGRPQIAELAAFRPNKQHPLTHPEAPMPLQAPFKPECERGDTEPFHPGEILREDILPALGFTERRLADHLGISEHDLLGLLTERTGITLDLALRLGAAFGQGARYWLALQMQHDLWHAQRQAATDVRPIRWPAAARHSGSGRSLNML